MKKIILASASPRRIELLRNTGLKFDIIESEYEEDMTLNMTPKNLAKFLSFKKAETVAKKYKEGIVIGADTFVVYNNHLLGKPHTKEKAKKMLEKINNKKIFVITGLTVINAKDGKKVSTTKSSSIYIRNLTRKEINNYVETGEAFDKAGAFAVQGLGANIIRKIEGDYFSVVGLPVFDLLKILRRLGFSII